MKSLNDIKEDQKVFKEDDHPLHGKDIVNMYEYYFEVLFMLKKKFKELGKVDYETVIKFDRTILDAHACDIPMGKEWRGMLDLYKY